MDIVLLADDQKVYLDMTGRLIDKLLLSAGLEGQVSKRVTSNASKPWPPVVVTLGRTATRAVLGRKAVTLGDVLGLAHAAHDGVIVVPIQHPSKLLKGKMKDVEEAVKTLIKCRLYVEKLRKEDTV